MSQIVKLSIPLVYAPTTRVMALTYMQKIFGTLPCQSHHLVHISVKVIDDKIVGEWLDTFIFRNYNLNSERIECSTIRRIDAIVQRTGLGVWFIPSDNIRRAVYKSLEGF